MSDLGKVRRRNVVVRDVAVESGERLPQTIEECVEMRRAVTDRLFEINKKMGDAVATDDHGVPLSPERYRRQKKLWRDEKIELESRVRALKRHMRTLQEQKKKQMMARSHGSIESDEEMLHAACKLLKRLVAVVPVSEEDQELVDAMQRRLGER